MDKKLKCPKCGQSNYSENNKGGEQTTFLQCKGCGFKGAEKAWKKQQKDLSILSSNNPFYKVSEGLAPDQKPASSYPSGTEKDPYPEKPARNRTKKKRTELLESYDESQSTEEVRRVSNRSKDMNPFYVQSKCKEKDEKYRNKDEKEYLEKGLPSAIDKKNKDEKKVSSSNPFYRKAEGEVSECPNCHHKCKGDKCSKCGKDKLPTDKDIEDAFDSIFASSRKNPFYKKAREFGDRSEHGKKMKELSDDNMTFPEDPNHSQKKHHDGETSKKKDPSGESSPNDELNPSYDYNTVDRKEQRSSPKPWDLEPGYKDWYEREVDQYYDGWLDDHIENSGGSVPGSNTEKTMNLDDDERAHAPAYPTEAIYEKLLENRHQFTDDYTTVVANGIQYTIKTSDAIAILSAGGIEDVKKKLRKGQ